MSLEHSQSLDMYNIYKIMVCNNFVKIDHYFYIFKYEPITIQIMNLIHV